jgi:dephospho-CoA kinase
VSTVVGLAGPIAAGKTTIALDLASQLGAPMVSFGDEVRSVAAKRGLPTDRATLQDVGEELIATGWESFCRAVLAQAPWRPGQSLVIDGIRHLGAITTLRRLVTPSSLAIVFLEASADARRPRLTARGTTQHESLAADAHRNEVELQSVREAADLVLPNTGNPRRTITVLLRSIPDLSSGPEQPPEHP